MEKALNVLVKEDDLAKNIEIKITDLYIRFLPENKEEYEDLASNPKLTLFSYPLLYEIKKMGNKYHDKSIPENKPTWQYTVVKPNFDIPNIKYEIISEVFLPSTYKKTANNTLYNSLAKLEDIALKLADINHSQISAANKANAANYSWYLPSATIRIPANNGNPATTDPVVGTK